MNADYTYCSNTQDECVWCSQCARHSMNHAPESIYWSAQFKSRGSAERKCDYFEPLPEKQKEISKRAKWTTTAQN